MEALGGGRVVNQAQLHRVRFIRDETCELDHAWGGTEDPVRAHCVVDVFLRDTHTLVSLCLGNEAPGNLDLILTVGRVRALFKMITSLHLEPVHVRGRGLSESSRNYVFEAAETRWLR